MKLNYYNLDFSVLIWISKVSSPKNVSSNTYNTETPLPNIFFTDKVNYLSDYNTGNVQPNSIGFG